MAREKDLNTFIEDILSKAQAEVKTLSTQKSTLIINLKELESKRDKLSQEMLDLSVKFEKDKKEYKEEVDAMLKSAQDKLNSAVAKESEAVRKTANLDQKQKEASDLIKSNEGLQFNLNKQNEETKTIKDNLIKKIETIKEIVKDL